MGLVVCSLWCIKRSSASTEKSHVKKRLEVNLEEKCASCACKEARIG